MGEFAKFIKTDQLRFKHAKGMRDIIGNEIHSYHEIFFFIDGDAEFVSEKGSRRLLPYTTVVIPKGAFHCFSVLGEDKDYCRCVFNFDEVSELNHLIKSNLSEIFLIQDQALTSLFNQMIALTEQDYSQLEKQILMKALFAQILVLVKNQDRIFIKQTVSNITRGALDYINNNLSASLTVSQIAKNVFVSPSYLAHVFKKDLRVPVHKYVLERRLTEANRMIKNSIPPTKAAISCGFTDYSGFYLQYKKNFGHPPSFSKAGKTKSADLQQ